MCFKNLVLNSRQNLQERLFSSIIEKNDDKMSTAIVYMKHQLSSPYHESRLISLNILTKMLRQVKVQNSVADGVYGLSKIKNYISFKIWKTLFSLQFKFKCYFIG